MARKIAPYFLVLALGACRSPGIPAPNLVAKPGWGRLAAPEHIQTTVRALPASAKPVLPPTRHGKPGWGR